MEFIDVADLYEFQFAPDCISGFDVLTLGINPPDGLYANSWGNTRTWGLDLRYDF